MRLGSFLGLAMLFVSTPNPAVATTPAEVELSLKIHQTIASLANARGDEVTVDGALAEVRRLVAETTEEWVISLPDSPPKKAKNLARAREFLRRLDWAHVRRAIEKSLRIVRTQGRIHGSGVIIGNFVGMIVEWTYPILTIALGHPEIAGITVFIPTGTVLSGIAYSVKELQHLRQAVAIHGGWKAYREASRVYREARAELGLAKSGTLLAPLFTEDGFQHFAAIREMNPFYRRLEKFGLRRETLHNASLKRWIQSEGWMSPEIHAVFELPEASANLKAVIAIQLLVQTYGVESGLALRRRFPTAAYARAIRADVAPLASIAELVVWTERLGSASNFDEVARIWREKPIGAKPVEMIELWRKFALPRLAERMADALYIRKFNGIVAYTEGLAAEARRYPEREWDAEWAAGWESALKTKAIPCDETLKVPVAVADP